MMARPEGAGASAGAAAPRCSYARPAPVASTIPITTVTIRTQRRGFIRRLLRRARVTHQWWRATPAARATSARDQLDTTGVLRYAPPPSHDRFGTHDWRCTRGAPRGS